MASNLQIFAGAMLPPSPVVLGRQLLPFSCWHALMLMLAGSPWVVGGSAPEWADTIFAVWLCGEPYAPERARSIEDVQRECADWGRSVGAWDHAAAAGEFREYLDASFRFPSLKTPASGGVSAVPWPFRAVSTVMHYLPQLSETEAWNMPVARVACYRACYAEDQGVDVTDDTTRALIARARAVGAL